ncbi:MAG: cysteine--tRNA ligase [Coriobacteriales bacterium]|jgi:cysteinyl-tRNA synthetase|nr:cysteine--tRNA ligase [Coriobacteriales bacterium]
MLIYNTLTRSKQEFKPLRPGKVGFYLCGPTVYNFIHIGNARTFLSFDVIRRYLEYSGYEVDFVQNITDVDDKIIQRAAQEGRTVQEVAEEYTRVFIDSMHALGIADPTIRPKATEEIPAMIELIQCLVEGGHAYEADGDVYFSVRSFAPYGRLSGRSIDEMRAGGRIGEDELQRKRDPLDFALWKAAKPGEPAWESPWGEGRPGWHIECSAMSAKYLGDPFDIHAGGDDLIFPHHENELAQSEACHHSGFANYWLHGGMLTIDREKMSKSEGNFMLLKDVLEQVSPQALRLLMLQTHYRSPFDYAPQRLEEATAALERIQSALRNMRWVIKDFMLSQGAGETGAARAFSEKGTAGTTGETGETGAARATNMASAAGTTSEADTTDAADADATGVADVTAAQQTRLRFEQAMDDDFNTAAAIAVVFELVSEGNRLAATGIDSASAAQELEDMRATILELLTVLGIELDEDSTAPLANAQGIRDLAAALTSYDGNGAEAALAALLEVRSCARTNKDWQKADAVRDGLSSLGLTIEDTPQGPRVVPR